MFRVVAATLVLGVVVTMLLGIGTLNLFLLPAESRGTPHGAPGTAQVGDGSDRAPAGGLTRHASSQQFTIDIHNVVAEPQAEAGAAADATASREGFASHVHAVDEMHLSRLLDGTSAWCQGNTVDTRRCRFENLCYNTASGDFVAVHGTGSVFRGLPTDRFGPSLLTLSSVLRHNVQYMSFVDLPGESS